MADRVRRDTSREDLASEEEEVDGRMSLPSTAVINVFGTGWLGLPIAPDFWSTMETVLAIVLESVRGRRAVEELEGKDHVSGMDAGERIFDVLAVGKMKKWRKLEGEMTNLGQGSQRKRRRGFAFVRKRQEWAMVFIGQWVDWF